MNEDEKKRIIEEEIRSIGDPMFNKLAETIYNSAMSRFKKQFEQVDWAVENIVKLQENDQGKNKRNRA